MVTRLDSSSVFHKMTPLESQSMTRESRKKKQFVCTQRNEHLFYASVMI